MMQAGLEEGAAAVEKERARVTKIISDKVMIDMVKMMVVITTKIRHDMQNLNKGGVKASECQYGGDRPASHCARPGVVHNWT